MKNKLEFNAYSIDETKGTVTYAVKSHGKIFVGVAKRSGSDKWNAEIGKKIAALRAEILQRKFDKQLTEEFIEWIKIGIGDSNPVSPHYMRTIQVATEEKKAQMVQIRKLKNELKSVLNQLN